MTKKIIFDYFEKGDDKVIISADRIITGDGSTVIEDGAVYITEEGKIGDVGTFERISSHYSEEKIIRHSGATLCPGLIDMHVHIGYWWNKPDSYNYNDFMIAYMALNNLKKAFSLGVTTLRDMGSPEKLCATIQKSAKKGYIQIPRIIGSDMGICMTGGHGHEFEGGITIADGPWEVRAAVREQIKNGAQWIKILTSHRTHTPEYTQDELNAAVDECHRLGKKIAVHAATHPSLEMCIEAGFDTIEHGIFLTKNQVEKMVEKNISWIPTITAPELIFRRIQKTKESGSIGNMVDDSLTESYEYFKAATEATRNNFKTLIETGVKVATGTDVVIFGEDVAPVTKEIEFMVKYGMEPIEAIKAATSTGADILGLSSVTGEIKKGLIADLIIVDGNPLLNISDISNIIEVYSNGKNVYKRAE